MGPASEAVASKSFNVLSDNGTSSPVSDMGRRTGLDHDNCVRDRALSRDCLEI